MPLHYTYADESLIDVALLYCMFAAIILLGLMWLLTPRIFRGSRHGGLSTEVAERAAIRGRRGTGAEWACYAQRGRPRKAAESRGRPRKAVGRAEPEPRIASVLCFHGNVEGTAPAGRRYSTPEAQKDIRNIKNTF